MSLAPVVAAAAAGGAAWGLLVPGLVNRYAVEWPDGAPRPPWRTTCPRCDAPWPPWWKGPECGHRPRPGRWMTVPLGALLAAVLAAAIGPAPELPAFLLLAAVAAPLLLVDLKVLRLPDPLIVTGLAGGALLLAVAALADGTADALLRAAVAAALSGGIYLFIALIPRSQLGFGDVKLAAMLGLYLGWVGWFAVVAGVVLAPILNLPYVLALLMTGKAGRTSSAPYGPAMIAGALAAIVVAMIR
jgi:leader peptidase (prepilin peptidase) / N-methyltransferase